LVAHFASVIFWTFKHHQSPHNWPDEDRSFMSLLRTSLFASGAIQLRAEWRMTRNPRAGVDSLHAYARAKNHCGVHEDSLRRFGRPFIALMAIDLGCCIFITVPEPPGRHILA